MLVDEKQIIKTWKILLPIIIVMTGFILLLNSSTPKSSFQTSNIHTGPINALPISSAIPTSGKTSIQPKTVNNNTPLPTPTATPNPYAIKASNNSIYFAVLFFSSLGNEKTKYIKQLTNGTNDLNLAIHNLALLIDNNPYLGAAILSYTMNKNSQGSSNTTIEDLESKIDNLNNKIDDLNDSLGY